MPLAAIVAIAVRQRRVARRLGLDPAGLRRLLFPGAVAVSACLALGLAAGRPAIETTESREVRAESELVVVVDVSRSMLASDSRGSKSRLARARSVAGRLRNAVPDVPAGLSGLTDRVLPYLFPTADKAVFDHTLRSSVLPEAPPPDEVNTVATTFEPLASLTRNGFFSPTAKRRTCLLITDGETRSSNSDTGAANEDSTPSLGAASSSGSLGARASDERSASPGSAALGEPPDCRLVVVRVGGPGDRIYGRGGVVEAAYRPEPGAAESAAQLAAAAGGRSFTEGSLAGAAQALRDAAQVGALKRVGVRVAVHDLAPYLAAVALLLALVAVVSRISLRLRLRRPRYDPSHSLRLEKGW